MDDESIELELGLMFRGLGDAKEYAAVLRDIVQLHTQVGRTAAMAGKSLLPGSDLVRAEEVASGASRSIPPWGATAASVSLPGGSKGKGDASDTFTKRTGGAVDALQKFTKILEFSTGGVSRVVKGLTQAYLTMITVAAATAAASNHYVEARATSGGTMSEVARLGLIGGNAGAARSFQERITSDPLAMGAAGRLGIHNLKGVYGDLDWTRQYLTAIERTAGIADERLRQQLSLTLGIEQEVAKYSLLSPSARQAMKEAADLSASFNDAGVQSQAQDIQVLLKAQKQSIENLGFSLVSVFGDDAIGLIEEVTKGFNNTAKAIKGARKKIREALGDDGKHYDTLWGAMTHGAAGDEGFFPGKDVKTKLWFARADMGKKFETELGMWTGGRLGDPGVATKENLWPHHLKGFRSPDQQAPVMANTAAIQANTAAMARLTGIIGGGQRTREALPSPLRGQILHEAMVSKQIKLGALG